ncbi:hypothetical protein [Mycolicibacterium thermoresistibile]
MAARPFVTTGIALVSAGVIAAVPAFNPVILSPQDEKLTAGDAGTAPDHTLTLEQLRLLALTDITLGELSDVFFQGYGGGVGPNDPYYPLPEGFSIYLDGFTGLAYYLTDQFLDSVVQTGIPLLADAAEFAYNNVTSYFYELGVWEAFRVAASELTGGPEGPVGIALGVAEFVAKNWVYLAGAALTEVTSLAPLIGPDLSYATSIFFFGAEQIRPIGDEQYVVREYTPGAVGVVNYIVDRILGQAEPWYEPPQDPDPEPDPDPEETENGDGDGADGLTSLLGSNAGSSALSSRFVTLDVAPNQKVEEADDAEKPGNVEDTKDTEDAKDTEDTESTLDEDGKTGELETETPAEKVTDGTGSETPAGDGAAAEGSSGLKQKPSDKIKPRLNVKRFNGPGRAAGGESTESRTGGKHRAEDRAEDKDAASTTTASTPTASTAEAAGASLSADADTYGKHAKKGTGTGTGAGEGGDE